MARRFAPLALEGVAAVVISSCVTASQLLMDQDPAIQALTRGAPPVYPDAGFAVCSDPHYYDLSLGTEGAAIRKYLAEDRKLLLQSSEILDQAVERIIGMDVGFVLVPGDLTKDGEKLNHQGFASALSRIEAAGTSVYVVPGNHDILNPHAVRYRGDTTEPVEGVTPEGFSSIYRDFGYSEALHRDPASLSYVAEPVKGLWLLALDSCDYAGNLEAGEPKTGGRYTREQLDWIEKMLITAAREGKAVIAMQHHGVVEHYPGQRDYYGDYVVDDSETVARLLAAYDVRVVFTGHYHAQDVTLARPEGGKFLFDVETGSLVTWPCPIREVVFSGNTMSIDSGFITSIASQGSAFESYGREFLANGITGIAIETMQELKVREEQAAIVAPLITQAYMAHVRGDETPPPRAEMLPTRGLGIMARLVVGNRKSLVEGWWQDLPPTDNGLTVDLATGTWAP